MADISVRHSTLARSLRGRNFLTLLRGIAGYETECLRNWNMDGLIEAVTLDSRLARPSSVFVALKGAQVDGHSFIADVAAQGCRTCLVSLDWSRTHRSDMDRWAEESGMLFVVFQEPLAALQDWARLYLASLGGLVKIGVTGSNGKTTTKELILSVLGQEHQVFASPGNMNSILGLPLAVLAVPETARIAVFEMAMSEKGEMDALAAMIRPDLGVITNIGRAHIGNIGSQEGIAAEKKRIFACMDNTSMAFIPDADPWADFLETGLAARICRYGEKVNPGYTGWEPWSEGQVIFWKGRSMAVRLSGEHHRMDILAAIRVAETLGVQDASIQSGLESFHAQSGRGQVIETARWTVVNDCYNANPDSMSASMKAFCEMPCRGHRIMILGNMAELGSDSLSAHQEIGHLAAALSPGLVCFVGSSMQAAHDAAQLENPGLDTRWFADKNGLAMLLPDILRDGDLVLLKGSRSMEMETLFPALGIAPAGKGSSS